MKILVVTNDFPPRIGGIEDYVARLLSHLSPDVSVRVFAPDQPGALAYDRAFAHPVARWPGYPMLPTPGLTMAIVDLLSRDRPDVLVFGAALPLALMSRAIRRKHDVPILAFTHGAEPTAAAVPGGAAMMRWMSRHVTAFTAVSRWAERQLRLAVGPRARVAQLPSGIDDERFRPDVSGHSVREQYALGPGPVIVCLSRLVQRKGHDQVIRALKGVAGEFPSVRLLIVGDGPDRPRLQRLALREGVSDLVVLAGAVPYEHLPACLAAGDLFAMPCRSRFRGLENEGLGAVFLQAAAVGRPAIAGQSGGAPEAVLHGDTGLVVDGRSVAAVEGAILRLLRAPEEARAMGERAAARVHADMTWAQMSGRLETLLQEVVSKAV